MRILNQIFGKKNDLPVVLRLWSIRAAKLRDNLRFGAYEDILLFIPSVIADIHKA